MVKNLMVEAFADITTESDDSLRATVRSVRVWRYYLGHMLSSVTRYTQLERRTARCKWREMPSYLPSVGTDDDAMTSAMAEVNSALLAIVSEVSECAP